MLISLCMNEPSNPVNCMDLEEIARIVEIQTSDWGVTRWSHVGLSCGYVATESLLELPVVSQETKPGYLTSTLLGFIYFKDNVIL